MYLFTIIYFNELKRGYHGFSDQVLHYGNLLPGFVSRAQLLIRSYIQLYSPGFVKHYFKILYEQFRGAGGNVHPLPTFSIVTVNY